MLGDSETAGVDVLHPPRAVIARPEGVGIPRHEMHERGIEGKRFGFGGGGQAVDHHATLAQIGTHHKNMYRLRRIRLLHADDQLIGNAECTRPTLRPLNVRSGRSNSAGVRDQHASHRCELGHRHHRRRRVTVINLAAARRGTSGALCKRQRQLTRRWTTDTWFLVHRSVYEGLRR